MRRSRSSLCWIDGFADSAEDALALRCLQGKQGAYGVESRPFTSIGKTSVFDVDDGRFPAAETLNMPLTIPNISRLERLLRPQPVVRSVFPKLPATGGHTVFLVRGATPVMLPAALLISALFARSNLLKWLLVPNSLDILALPGDSEGDLRVLEVGAVLRNEQMTDAAYRTLAWVAHNDDARRAWSSVFFNALEGKIDMALPKVRLECWLRGTLTPWGVLASGLSSVEVGVGTPLHQLRVVYGASRLERVIPSYVPRARSPVERRWG